MVSLVMVSRRVGGSDGGLDKGSLVVAPRFFNVDSSDSGLDLLRLLSPRIFNCIRITMM